MRGAPKYPRPRWPKPSCPVRLCPASASSAHPLWSPRQRAAPWFLSNQPTTSKKPLTAMDQRLLAWGLRQRGSVPPLWLFTDARRLPDPRPSVRALPRGRAGVVLRHDGDPDRLSLGRDLARICRVRRLVLVVAGDARLAARLHAGVHLRGGRWPGQVRLKRGRAGGFVTSSAHNVADVRRAARAGADVVFLSPAFPTESHAGAAALGALRWAAMARRALSGKVGSDWARCDREPCGEMRVALMPPGTPARPAIGALGGIDGGSIRCLPPQLCCAAGAIGALSSHDERRD
jgi:thiamine-phosphate pyrophosphorylase